MRIIVWYDASGRVIEETDASGNLVNDYIYGAGMRLARKDSSGNVYGYISDPLGSVRYVAGPSGTHAESDWYPFGGERVISDTLTSPNNYKFTGMERDTETGLDHTLFRQFSSSYGRWYSPDRKGGNVANPQTWNRYAYVLNNPTTLIDPLGLSGSYYMPGAQMCSNVQVPSPYADDCASAMESAEAEAEAINSNGDCMQYEYGCDSTSSMGNDIFDTLAGVATPEERLYSIFTTGYDPVLGINWNDPNLYLSEAQGQLDRLSGNLGKDFKSGDYTLVAGTCNLIGGHCNFGFHCNNWEDCRPGRYDNGIHIECASGGYICPEGSDLVVHDDTVSPWTGSFNFGDILTIDFAEHAIIDYIGGSVFVEAFAH